MKKKILTYAGIILAMLVLSYAYVPQVLGGKIVNQSDISGWQGMSHEMMEWNAAHPDDKTAWTQSMFGGMPTATIHSSTDGDWTQSLYDLLLTGRRPATYLFISLVGAWLLMLAFGIHPLIAAGGAVAVTFCSYNLQIIQVGHNTKMQALAFLPWALAAFVYTLRTAYAGRRNHIAMTISGSALFGLALSFQVKANHPQITYYLAILIVLYALVFIVWMLCDAGRRKAAGRLFAACSLLLVLGLTGIATNAVKLLPTYEYTPYSMRGGSTEASGGDGSKGLSLDYATAWSYGWEELPNLLIPNFNGGSSAGAVNPRHSETYDLLERAGQPNLEEVRKNLPLYWGPQPFTAGPMYMGAVTVFLFVLGLFVCTGKEKWWILICTVLAVLLALGSHFMWFTRLFYDYAPFYNKFRTVSMALVILQFTLPLLAFLALDKITKEGVGREEFRRKGLAAFAVTAGFCLLASLLSLTASSFTSPADNAQPEILSQALRSDRRHLLLMDMLRSLGFITAAFALLYRAYKDRGAAPGNTGTQSGHSRRCLAALIVCALVLLDLVPVSKRYLNADDFVSEVSFRKQFTKRTVDRIILEDTDPSYRVLDLTVNVFNDSHPSYWHKNIGGYSPAKLQRYQEFIEESLTDEINSLFRAVSGAATIEEAEDALPYCPGLAEMNCRYIIIGDELPPLRYKYAKGNAWLSDSLGTAVMTSYAPNEMHYRYSASEDCRITFSEVYYPEGWTLVVDGSRQLPIELEGHLLRSAAVPAGEHELVMRFEPRSYIVGERISRASSVTLILLVLLSLAGAAVTMLRRKAAV